MKKTKIVASALMANFVLAGAALVVIGQSNAQTNNGLVRLDEEQDGKVNWLTWRDNRAKSTLAVANEAPVAGDTSIRFSADFTEGGSFVGLEKKLAPLNIQDIAAIRFKLKTESASQLTARFTDGTGQTFQRKGIKLTANGQWQDMVLKPAEFAGGEKWGGANDGRWHGKPQSFVLMLVPGAGEKGKTPEVLLSNVQAETLPTAPAIASSSNQTSAAPVTVAGTIRLDEVRDGKVDWMAWRDNRVQSSLAVDQDAPVAGSNSMRFSADFTEGGAFAGYEKKLGALNIPDIAAVRFKYKTDSASQFTARFTDGTGQTFQRKGIKVTPDNQWHEIVLRPSEFAGGEKWGGANNGKWHGKPQSFVLMLVPGSGEKGKTPSVLVADVQADTLPNAPVIATASTQATAPPAPAGVLRLDEVKNGKVDWITWQDNRAKSTFSVANEAPEAGGTSIRYAADFTEGGSFVGLEKKLTPLNLQDIAAIRFKLKTDSATRMTIRFTDGTGQTFQRKGINIQADGQWNEMVFKPTDFTGGEKWGGARDGKWYGKPQSFVIMLNPGTGDKAKTPEVLISNIVAEVLATAPNLTVPTAQMIGERRKSEEYGDFNPGDNSIGGEWVKSIVIKTPELRSEVKGDVLVSFQAPGMTTARAMCWQQPTAADPNPYGHDVVLADKLKLDAEGNGSFVFPADQFPNGPVTVRVLVQNPEGQRDIREIQLWNKGGVVWNQGIPKSTPPGAAGMKVAFADDFDKPISISKDGVGTTYMSHKPGGGDFSGWIFSDAETHKDLFTQHGTFLRIRASKGPGNEKGSTGLISSVRKDFSGFYMKMPFYVECRFSAQSAPGTWPAFWTLTKNHVTGKYIPGDELDIVEAYGGVGPGNPNAPGYSIVTHFWHQKDADGNKLKNPSRRVPMRELGGKSYWSTTFHTYGVRVDEKDTVYYFDDIEVLRHPTGEVSKAEPHFFLINYAIGGISGWKIDLEREGNVTDMWVDYVRAFQGESTP